MLHKETVDASTLELLKQLMADRRLKDFVLVGGTALSLQMGHRISADLRRREIDSISPGEEWQKICTIFKPSNL